MFIKPQKNWFMSLLLFFWGFCCNCLHGSGRAAHCVPLEQGWVSSFLNVISWDTSSNLAHIKPAFFMKPGRWAPCKRRCEMSWAPRCQGCAIISGAPPHGHENWNWNSGCKDSDLCHQMLVRYVSFPSRYQNPLHCGGLLHCTLS